MTYGLVLAFHCFIINFVIRNTIALEEGYDFSPPIFTMYRCYCEDCSLHKFNRRCFYCLKECSFSPLGIFFTEKPSKEASSLRTVSKYFLSFGSLALLLLSTWPEMTWESVLRIALLTPITFSFRSPNRMASYSAMLFVQLKFSLVA
jgi:hypothetical protein